MVTNRVISKLIHILFPIVLGTSIEMTSFSNITIYIFILTLLQIVMSFYIDKSKFNTECRKERYSLKNYFKSLTIKQREKLNRIYKSAYLYGIMMDTIRVLVVIITIMTFKTSFNLGILTTVFAICSMLSLCIFNKIYKNKNIKIILIICATLVVLGVVGLLLNISRTTLIIYNFMYSITTCILEVMLKINSGNMVKENNIEQWVVEHHSCLEGFMDIGRVTGFLLMLLVSLLNNVIYFKILLLLVTICIPIYAKVMYDIEKDKIEIM